MVPSRAGSRMQQYEDKNSTEIGDPTADGAINDVANQEDDVEEKTGGSKVRDNGGDGRLQPESDDDDEEERAPSNTNGKI